MKNKILSICTILVFLFTSLISVEAIAPTPRVDLDEYQIEATDKNNVFVTGTVTLGLGQLVGVYNESGTILYNYTQVDNSGSAEDFKIQIPSIYLKGGDNTFKVKSLPLKGYINASNTKTVTVKIKTTKKNQTITANNISLKVGESKNIGAKVDSGLKLTYSSGNSSIATVDSKGNIVGRKAGTVKVTITQSGNDEYNPISKTITVTVTEKVTPTPTPTKKEQKITTKFDKYQFYDVNKIYKLGAKVNSGLKLTYKSSNKKVATVNSKGEITSKSPGTAVITISQKGNKNYKAATKKVLVKVPKIKDRQSALKPWYDAMQKQADYTQGVHYGWPPSNQPTIQNSKYYSTCITFVSVALQRCQIIKSGRYITASTDHNGSGRANCIAKSKSAAKSINSRYMTVIEVNGKVKDYIRSGKILPGDILGLNWHTCAYYGKDKNGNNRFCDGGRILSGDTAASRNHVKINWINNGDNNSTVWLIARVNTFTVKSSCEDGNITMSNQYMAGQNVKVTYSPSSGKKLKSIIIDGKELSKSQMRKYKNSYTFSKLDINHNIKVIYE